MSREKSRTYAAHLQGKNCYDEEDYKGGTAFLIGNEGNGLTEELSSKAGCVGTDSHARENWSL